MDTLILRGARAHNLRDLDLDLPLGSWLAVTGISGSGKTSLVFDTLVREGQRRTFGSLSARARQTLGKLGRADADVIRGLPAAVAVGQRDRTSSARSTVGTLTGILPPLRLLFARQATDPSGVALTRSHFSFNHSLGACEACGGLGLEDRVDPALLVADPRRSIRQGALRPTLKSGYTVYSQVTVEVMDRICRAHGFDVDTPWQDLTDAQRHVILYGTRALKVPFGKHSLQSRMRWEGITAKPREEGYYRGLLPVIQETLARNRNDNVLRFVRSVPCGSCGGSRLARPGRQAELGGRRLPQLMETPLRDLGAALKDLPPSEVLDAVRSAVSHRLTRLTDLGLGHLTLARRSTTLSGGEAQRVRLVAHLGAELGGMLFALDEPTLGLHPDSQAGLRAVLEDIRALGNTVITVEHDPDMVRHADRVLHLGPGAGPDGGRILFDGATPPDPLGPPPAPRVPRTPRGWLTLRGATLHNLADADLPVALGALNVVLGPSGAGKSSLVFGTLLPALKGEAGGPYRALQGVPEGLVVEAVDAQPIGRTPRSTPATWSGLFDHVRKRFAATREAREAGLTAGRFSYNGSGKCPTCEGLGFQRIGLHLMQDVERPCEACGGSRYAPEVLEVNLGGATIADVLGMTVREAVTFFADDPPILALVQAMEGLGLGYLPLGRSSTTLSRGEAQRIKLATLVGARRSGPALLLLDEPDRGLHPDDVRRLVRTLETLVERGDTVVAISHHRHLWAAADQRVGLREGKVTCDPPLCWDRLSTAAPRPPAPPPEAIVLRGVRTHNLRCLDVRIPHRRLTAIVGVSGSGKSSLALHTLAAEGLHRLSEGLPFEVRRHLRRLPRPDLDAVSGLTPTVALRQERATLGRRATVATQTGIGPLLRLLWSRAGEGAGWTAEHFSPDRPLGACPACEGVGVVLKCDPERLVTHPELPLGGGALQGTRPGRFFGDPEGQHLATLQAAVGVALDRPWRELAEEVRQVALYGSDQPLRVRWRYTRGKRRGEHTFEGTWDGLCALVEREAKKRAGRKRGAEWAEPLVDVPCPACEGARLRPEIASVRVGGLTLPEVMGMAASAVAGRLGTLAAAVQVVEPLARGGAGEEGERGAPGAGAEGCAARPARQAALDALRPELLERLEDLIGLGVGHLTLDRQVDSLSGGELQRVRLATVLRSGSTGTATSEAADEGGGSEGSPGARGPRDDRDARPSGHPKGSQADGHAGRAVAVTGLTLVLDEPAAGLHRREVAALGARLRRLVDHGNTVVVVTHRPELIRAADHLLELGPDAGPEGGRIVAEGSVEEVLAGDTPTARALRALEEGELDERGARVSVEERQEVGAARIREARPVVVRGARAHNLQGIDAHLPGAGVVAVTGVSGSGKSTLVFEVLVASARRGRAVGCDRVEGLARYREIRAAQGSGSTPLTELNLLPRVQALYQGVSDGMPRQAFSFHSPAGRCDGCGGSGVQRVSMDFLADLRLPCPRCGGRRYKPEVLAVRWEGLDIAAFLDTPVDGLADRVPDPRLQDGLQALRRVGLGHLPLGRRRGELSGGERQRLLLAACLLHAPVPSLIALDEPGSGLHEADLPRLTEVLGGLARAGHLVLLTTHRATLVAAADEVVELGPGSGAQGGRLVGHRVMPQAGHRL